MKIDVVNNRHVQNSTHALMHSLSMAHQQAILDLMRKKEIELQKLKAHYEAQQLRTVLEIVSISVIDPLGVEHKLAQVPRSLPVSSDYFGLLTPPDEHHNQELGSIILGRHTNPAMVTFLERFLATDRFQLRMNLSTTVVTEEHLLVLEDGTTVVMNAVFIELRRQNAMIKCPLCRGWIGWLNGGEEKVLW